MSVKAVRRRRMGTRTVGERSNIVSVGPLEGLCRVREAVDVRDAPDDLSPVRLTPPMLQESVSLVASKTGSVATASR